MKVVCSFKNNSAGLSQKRANTTPQQGQGLFLPSLLDGGLVLMVDELLMFLLSPYPITTDGPWMASISPQLPHQAQAERYMLPQP